MQGYFMPSYRRIPAIVLSVVFSLVFFSNANATHNRAGEIIYKHLSGFTYQATIITYTKESSVAADRDSLEIVWGDNTRDTLARSNGGGNGVYIGNDIKYNEYTGVHTYPGMGSYVLSMTDPNRITDIININGGNSVNEPFYIEDTLKIPDPQFYAFNSSPILLNPPIDFGNAFQTFIHNPNAYDPDGDSLTFEFIVPRKGASLPVQNYVDPNQIPGTPAGQTFTIDHATGEVVWSTPIFCDIYNFAILIKEFRKGICIGTMVRDMEVIVNCTNNNPPVIAAIFDTCVIAGAKLELEVVATDQDVGQHVTMTSNGGPYELAISPATFSSVSGTGEAVGNFEWNTTCDHVRGPFYQVIFKAQDSYSVPLVDIKNWLITVVAPPPQGVVAVPSGNDVLVSWANPYACAGTARFIGFSVWRKEGSNPFVVNNCDVGLNGKGYIKIAQYLADYQFLDVNAERGKLYCYRILAEFADKTPEPAGFYYNNVESLPSPEACAQLLKEVPVITNVSVTTTSTNNGTMYIAWSKPSPLDLDTLQNPGPYKYVIWRSVGMPGGLLQRIDSFSALTFGTLNDSTYNDDGLNTLDNPYSYKIGFYSNGNFIGETEIASSVFVNTTGIDNAVLVDWTLNVPWQNAYYAVYRKNSIGTFDSIGVSTTLSYTDGSLANGVEQCYYVKSEGSYSAPGFINPIINLSQQVCDVPVDSIGPCAPALNIKNLCNTENFALTGFTNELIWNNPNHTCADDVISFNVYFAGTADQPLALIGSLSDTFFIHTQDNTIAGCYAVAAVDSYANEGPKSSVVCVENCPVYELPNVFTPNGDERNDLFHPFLPIRFVEKIDIKIFDQWGALVFQTTDPFIGWNGKDLKTGKDVAAGTYYYVCDVFANGDAKAFPTLSGYIHLFR
ncbi:MAG: gliding motility-associated C-terminal domain-containing protein [Chitinophagaceae bacterium]|nr:gliding motility-associated C-terminal domain-containing protein [Chitinophagaceae bacterium]